MEVGEHAVKAAARALANYIGHGMTEKCVDKATVALTAALPHLTGVGVKKLDDVALSASVNSYASNYEFRGDNGDYTPTDGERVMIEDAIEGFLSNFLSSLEPSAAREMALEEAARVADELEERTKLKCASPDGEECQIVPLVLLIEATAAIRALGTSREQLNKAVSNVPDQQENEPGAHGERERALEEPATLLEREADELDGLVDSVSHHLRSKAKTIRALSFPDHADAGKVEGDGWLPTHRHKKRGTHYSLIGLGRMQTDSWHEPMEETATGSVSVDLHSVAIYRSVDDGSLWVRPREEFEDGRFETLPTHSSGGDRHGE